MNLKKKFYILFLSIFLNQINPALAADVILPKQKPTINELKKTILDVIPLKKPLKILKKELKIKEKIKIVKKNKKILPKKKPLVFKNIKEKVAAKSKYYSKKDFQIAKKAISLVDKRDWKNALKTSKKAKDKSIYRYVQWKHLITRGNAASYYEYLTFINKNPNYPRINRLKYLSEHKLSTEKISYSKIINIYKNEMPLSGYGKLILGESKILNNEVDLGISLIKEGWITASLSKQDLRYFRKKYKKYLSQ